MAARHKMKTAKAGAGSVMVAPEKKGEASIAIPGVDVMKESKQKSKGFKKGGGVKSTSCASETTGPVKGRLDKPMRKASGGGVSMRGRSPLSAAASTSAPSGKVTH